MKNKKNFSSWCINQRNMHTKRLLCLLRKDTVLAIGQNAGEVAGIKIQLKRFFKNIDTITLYLNPARQKIITIIVERSQNVCF
jgi:hypothetical protein